MEYRDLLGLRMTTYKVHYKWCQFSGIFFYLFGCFFLIVVTKLGEYGYFEPFSEIIIDIFAQLPRFNYVRGQVRGVM